MASPEEIENAASETGVERPRSRLCRLFSSSRELARIAVGLFLSVAIPIAFMRTSTTSATPSASTGSVRSAHSSLSHS
jgi:hypothetical protein